MLSVTIVWTKNTISIIWPNVGNIKPEMWNGQCTEMVVYICSSRSCEYSELGGDACDDLRHSQSKICQYYNIYIMCHAESNYSGSSRGVDGLKMIITSYNGHVKEGANKV